MKYTILFVTASFAIAKFDSSLQPFSQIMCRLALLIGMATCASGYEAIFHHDGSFFVVRESVLHHNHDDDEVDGEEEMPSLMTSIPIMQSSKAALANDSVIGIV